MSVQGFHGGVCPHTIKGDEMITGKIIFENGSEHFIEKEKPMTHNTCQCREGNHPCICPTWKSDDPVDYHTYTVKKDATELKPCPFCGYAAEIRNHPDNAVYIGCKKCDCSTSLIFNCGEDARPKATQAWNARVGC